MKKKLLRIVAVFFALIGLGAGFAIGVEEYADEAAANRAYNVTRVTKTVDGLKFAVQEDRPIEKVGGIYKPIDIDSYVAYKFNKLEDELKKKFDEMSARIESLAKKVQEAQERISKLEESESREKGDSASSR